MTVRDIMNSSLVVGFAEKKEIPIYALTPKNAQEDIERIREGMQAKEIKDLISLIKEENLEYYARVLTDAGFIHKVKR